MPELNEFEAELLELVKNIEFKNKHNSFQEQLKSEENFIQNEPNKKDEINNACRHKLSVLLDKT